MMVTFTQSGGFAGLLRSCQVDSRDVPAPLHAALLALLAGDKPGPTTRRAGHPDSLHFTIETHAPDNHRLIQLDSSSIPPEFTPLIDWLAARAQPASLQN